VDELTPKQALFVDEFMVDRVANRAAKRAGYSSARGLLTNPAIKAAINERIRQAASRAQVNETRVLAEAATIAFADLGEIVSIESGAHGDRIRFSPDGFRKLSRAVASLEPTPEGEIKIKMHNKLGALSDLMKHLGLLKDKVEVSHSGRIGVEHSGKVDVHAELDRITDEILSDESEA
jgi:phage terminase small subunit